MTHSNGSGTGVSTSHLSQIDRYALARAFVGLPVEGLSINPTIGLLLNNLDWSGSGRNTARQILGAEELAAILALDPEGEPPSPPQQRVIQDWYCPPLPAEAVLTDQALKASEQVGEWYRAAYKWACEKSPITPQHFISSGIIWVLGLAIARRVVIEVHDRIYPNLFLLLVAETSKYAKSTGLKALQSLVLASMPHMLIPGHVTPEGMIEMLSGQLPTNFEKLPRRDQELITKGRELAAQRGIILDEYSSLLGSHRKDYMQGFVELLMKLYDANDQEMHYTRSGGLMIIRYPGLAIMGATTPAAMQRSLSVESWENGQNARYLVMFRDKALPYTTNIHTAPPPQELIAPLRKLHAVDLPRIKSQMAFDEDEDTDDSYNPLCAMMSQDAIQQHLAYSKAVRNDLLTDDLDDRLHGNYNRLHVQALKIALSVACMDWSQAGAKGPITISLGHYALGQTIAEQGRESLHRLMPVLSQSMDSRTQRDVLSLLGHHQEMTVRDVVRMSGRSANEIRNALDVLVESGEIEAVQHRPSTGRPTVIFRRVSS